MSHSIPANTPYTADELKTLLSDAEQALSQSAGDRFASLRNRLQTALEHGKDALDNVRLQTTYRVRQADQLVHEKPYYAMGIAAGVGALIGILISRSGHGSR